MLGIESSGGVCAVGVSSDSRIIGEISLNSPNIHSTKLASCVDFILHNLQVRFEELSAIALSAGPGSFTGLRIGYSFAKGIAHPLGIPIIEVPTLDAWAYQEGEQQGQTLAVIDAYRDELFYAMYERRKSRLKRATDYAIIKIDELGRRISAPTRITGSISEKIQSQISSVVPNALFSNRMSAAPSMAALLELASDKFRRKEFSDLDDSEPFYMRKFKGVS